MSQKFVGAIITTAATGKPINSKIKVNGFNNFSLFAEFLLLEMTKNLGETENIPTSYKISGEYCPKDGIDVFDLADQTKKHERFHQETYKNGFKGPLTNGYITLDEGMAYAIEDRFNESNIWKVRATTPVGVIGDNDISGA